MSSSFAEFPTQDHGRKILDALLERTVDIRLLEETFSASSCYSSDSRVSLASVIADLPATSQIRCFDQTSRGVVHLKRDQLISGMLSSMDSKFHAGQDFYAVPEVGFTPQGSGKCGSRLPPQFWNDVTMHCPGDGTIDVSPGFWSTTLAPPGSVTDIHHDFHGCATLIVPVQGHKLWLLWPSTPKNLALRMPEIGKINPEVFTLKAIQQMEGLRLHHQKDDTQAFVMPPYTFHAVITFTLGVHHGVGMRSLQWTPDAIRGMEWELDWVKNRKKYGDPSDEEVDDVLEGIQTWGVGRLTQLEDALPTGSEDKNYVRRQINDIQEKIDAVAQAAGRPLTLKMKASFKQQCRLSKMIKAEGPKEKGAKRAKVKRT